MRICQEQPTCPASAPTSARRRCGKERSIADCDRDLRIAARVLAGWSLLVLGWHGVGPLEIDGLAAHLGRLEHLGQLGQFGLDPATLLAIGHQSFDSGTLAIAILVLVWALALALVFTTLLRAEDRKADEGATYEFFEESIEVDDDDDDDHHGMPGRRLVH